MTASAWTDMGQVAGTGCSEIGGRGRGGRLHSIGIDRTHARTRVLVVVQDLDIRVSDAAAGGLLRELVLDPTKRYQAIHNNP